MGYYFKWEDFPEREVSYLKGLPESSKLRVRIMSAEKIMITQVDARKGAHVGKHRHEAEQILIIFKGQMRVTTGKEPPRVIGPGNIWVVPSNCPHGAEYIEDTEALEVVSPIRLDNFTGYTISHTFFEDDDS